MYFDENITLPFHNNDNYHNYCKFYEDFHGKSDLTGCRDSTVCNLEEENKIGGKNELEIFV